MENLISIIVPVYNVENYLRKCVDSIINQSYKNLEIILVDDGSTDSSGKICDEYSLKDSRIKVIHKKNGGLSDARNAGMEIASGDFWGFVDSDDYIDSDMYSVLMENLLGAEADLSTCGRIFTYDGKEIPKYSENNPVTLSGREAVKNLFLSNSIVNNAAWDKLYKRELFDDIKFPVGRLFEDAAIMYKIFEKCNKIVSTKKQMYHYVQRSGSISNCKYNKNKVMHQVENRVSAVEYFSERDSELKLYAIVWNLRFDIPLWCEAKPNDEETAENIFRISRKYFTVKAAGHLGIKLFVKHLMFYAFPGAVLRRERKK